MISSVLLHRSPPRYEGKHLLKKFVTLSLLADFFGNFFSGSGVGDFRILEYILVVDHSKLIKASAECWSS